MPLLKGVNLPKKYITLRTNFLIIIEMIFDLKKLKFQELIVRRAISINKMQQFP